MNGLKIIKNNIYDKKGILKVAKAGDSIHQPPQLTQKRGKTNLRND